MKENDAVLVDLKDQILRILNAFLKAGLNLERDVYPRMKYKGMYMPEFMNAPGAGNKARPNGALQQQDPAVDATAAL